MLFRSEVDGPPCNNVLPLGVWELRAIWLIDEGTFSCPGIDRIGLDELKSLCEGVLQDSALSLSF